jgi:Zn-dependent protease with chaperone function
MLTEAQRRRKVATTDSAGLLLYALTLLGEIPNCIVRGLLGGVAVGALNLLSRGSVGNLTAAATIAGVGPLLWSLTALLYPLGTGAWWRATAGARRPSAREREEYDRVIARFVGRDGSIRLPRHVYVLEDNSPNAAVTGDALMLNRGLLDSGWLEAVLAHELGHLNCLDGELTAARNRLVIKRNTLEPDDPDRERRAPISWLLLALARGGRGLLLTRPLWGAWDRDREYLCDQFAAHLGQGEAMKEFLETEVLLHDRPAPFGWMVQQSHPPTELRLDALSAPPAQESPSSAGATETPPRPRSRLLAGAVALAGIALIGGIGLSRIVTSRGPSIKLASPAGETAAHPSVASQIEDQIGETNPWTFAEVDWGTTASCRPTADPHVFRCTLTNESGATRTESFELYNGTLARVSDGGDTGAAPATDARASQLVSSVLQHRGPRTRSASCRTLIAARDNPPVTEAPYTYTCTILNNGRSIGNDPAYDEPIRVDWQWNPDGSVADETDDIYQIADETTR